MNVKCVTLFDMVVKQGHVVYCVCGVIVVRVGGKKREKPVSKGTCTQKGNVFETTLKRTSVKHQGLFSEASFNTFEIVTSHNFDVLTNNFCRCFTQVFVLSTKQDSAHNFLSSTLGSRFGSGSWPLSLVSECGSLALHLVVGPEAGAVPIVALMIGHCFTHVCHSSVTVRTSVVSDLLVCPCCLSCVCCTLLLCNLVPSVLVVHICSMLFLFPLPARFPYPFHLLL